MVSPSVFGGILAIYALVLVFSKEHKKHKRMKNRQKELLTVRQRSLRRRIK